MAAPPAGNGEAPPQARLGPADAATLEALPDPVLVLDRLTFEVLHANALAQRQAGRPLPHAGTTLLDLCLPEDRPQALALLRDLGDGPSRLPPLRHGAADGSVRTLEAATAPVQWDGRPALLAVARDVTDARRQAVLEADGHRRLRTLLDAASDFAILMLDVQGRILEWSQGAAVMFEWPADAIRLQPFDVLFTPDDRAAGKPTLELERAKRDGAAVDENWGVCRSGRRFWLSGMTRAILDERGDPVGFVKVARDLTDLRRAHEALRESEERFRRIFDDGPLGVAIVALDRSVAAANPALARMLGRTQDELAQSALDDLIHPDDVDKDVDLMRQLLDGQLHRYQVEVRVRMPDGGSAWAQFSWSLLRDSAGRPRSRLAVVEDVTARKRAEASLQEVNDRLRRLDAERTAFVNVMAHELRGPMTALVLRLALLREPGVSVERQREALAAIDSGLRRLEGLLQLLQDVARIESGHLPMQKGRVRLDALLREVAELHVGMARQNGVRLEVAAEGPCHVEGDATRLAQVVANLVSNAIKFTPASGLVALALRVEGKHAVVEVRDTGVGFTTDQARRLFARFSQVHGEGAKGGTGLGLYISRAIVHRHGGLIRAESPGPGQGATFVVELPLADAPALHAAQARGEGPAVYPGQTVDESKASAPVTTQPDAPPVAPARQAGSPEDGLDGGRGQPARAGDGPDAFQPAAGEPPRPDARPAKTSD